MKLSYRTRRRLRRSLTVVAIVLCLSLTAFIGWVVWAERYIIYTRDGAKLDFALSQNLPEGSPAEPPKPFDPVKIIVQEQDDSNNQAILDQVSISGYYIQSQELKENIPDVLDKLLTLPEGTAVLIDMKSIKGSFNYPTTVGSTVSKDIDQEQMSKLLDVLSTYNLHAIARIPAFRDWEYGLHNVPLGLPKKGGNGSLWMDDKNCYWLDPTKEDVIGYLINIVAELKSMGFDEVVFTDFRFPDTDKIKFTGDKSMAITNAAATIADACATDRFFISFQSTDYAFPLPKNNTRLYLQDVPAADIPLVRQQSVADNPSIQLLFLTETNDTRYDDYCVLRPLADALITEEPAE